MCGIVAIHAYGSSAPPPDLAELRRIRDHMERRGPDGFGEWSSPDRRTAFGHRRLSIIDLSDRAAQPMSTADGQLVITFNGEIYNHQALRTELESKGYVFRTQSDTEVLLHLYAERGPAMVEALRGMFAFAIWDARERKLFLARDPYGIKPLYYADDGSTIRVASQVKALMAGGAIFDEVDPAGAVGFLMLGSVPEPFTIQRDIALLPAGCHLTVTENGLQKAQTYFSIAAVFTDAAPFGTTSPTEIAEAFKTALRDTVKHHLVADVPVGAFLSAGVDSGALVGMMSELGEGPPLQTITLGFEQFRGKHQDETILAAEIAKHYGVSHATHFITAEQFTDDLPRILAAMDQPSVDGINTWMVSKAAHNVGLKVAVSGLGGDELLGGYPSFASIPKYVNAFRHASRLPLVGKAIRKLSAPLLPHLPVSPKAAGLIELGGTYEGAYLLRRGLFMPWELPTFLPMEFVQAGLERLQPLPHIRSLRPTHHASSFAQVASLEASLYMRNQLLRDADWASMDHSLEIRVPLVDSVLLKTLAPALLSPNRPTGKSALGAAPRRPLPTRVTQRTKTGFSLPMNEWLAAAETTSPTATRVPGASHWSRRWAVRLIEDHLPRE